MFWRWFFTVLGLIPRAVAISLFVVPLATRPSTSRSRRVRWAIGWAPVVVSCAWRANSTRPQLSEPGRATCEIGREELVTLDAQTHGGCGGG